MGPHERIIFALDVCSDVEACRLVDLLHGHVGAFKVGLELFMNAGPETVRQIVKRAPVMLDLKLHDVPKTVERAVRVAGDLGVRFCTLHVQQRDAMDRAAQAASASGVKLLAVTVLTSMDSKDLRELLQPDGDYHSESTLFEWFEPGKRVVRLAALAHAHGIDGYVCSPEEAQALRHRFPKATLVTPGVRTSESATGGHRRTGTPFQAIQDGSDYVVVGSTIRDAEDPVRAAHGIAMAIRGDVSAGA